MTRLRRWWAAFWQALADALESVGDVPDDFLD